MSEIKTKSFNYGDKNESEWPPKFGTGKGGHFYYCQEDKCMKEGYPPVKETIYGEAPMIMPDSLRDKHYHQGACRWAESRSELNRMDAETGCITTDKPIQADNKARRQKLVDERKKDIRQATMRAINAVNQGTVPLPEHVRAACAIQDRVISNALNMDAYNFGKRKKDGRGKRYRK